MVNQQKGVQQDIAYSAVVVNNCIPVPAYIIFYDPVWVKKRYRNGDPFTTTAL